MDTIKQLEDRVAELESLCSDIAGKYVVAEKRTKLVTQRAKIWGSLAACALVAVVVISPGNKAIAQGYGESFSKLVADVNALKQKTQFMSVNGKTTTFTGCNVQIVNGLGATDGNPNDPFDFKNDAVTNGLGNLIIGYNLHGIGDGPQTGSHNLILGDGNGFTSYGGIVDGEFNTISGPYASITGGSSNTVTAEYSSITGDAFNKAAGFNSTVSGGYANNASGSYSSVSGGEYNLASGEGSEVSGGYGNTSSASESSVSGGYLNVSEGNQSSVSGGQGNYASASAAAVSGGSNNTATGFASSIAAGYSNIASGEISSCLGGYLCRSDDPFSAVLGGYNSTVNTGNGYTHFP